MRYTNIYTTFFTLLAIIAINAIPVAKNCTRVQNISNCITKTYTPSQTFDKEGLMLVVYDTSGNVGHVTLGDLTNMKVVRHDNNTLSSNYTLNGRSAISEENDIDTLITTGTNLVIIKGIIDKHIAKNNATIHYAHTNLLIVESLKQSEGNLVLVTHRHIDPCVKCYSQHVDKIEVLSNATIHGTSIGSIKVMTNSYINVSIDKTVTIDGINMKDYGFGVNGFGADDCTLHLTNVTVNNVNTTCDILNMTMFRSTVSIKNKELYVNTTSTNYIYRPIFVNTTLKRLDTHNITLKDSTIDTLKCDIAMITNSTINTIDAAHPIGVVGCVTINHFINVSIVKSFGKLNYIISRGRKCSLNEGGTLGECVYEGLDCDGIALVEPSTITGMIIIMGVVSLAFIVISIMYNNVYIGVGGVTIVLIIGIVYYLTKKEKVD